MSEIDFFGHFGYFFLLMGMIYVGAKEPAGWFMRLFGEMIWICLGFVLGLTSIWMWGLVFVAVDYYNFRKWMEEERQVELMTDFVMDDSWDEPLQPIDRWSLYDEVDTSPDCTGDMHQPFCRQYVEPKIGKFGMPYYETK